LGGLPAVRLVRDHIGAGSWLALIALALNLAVSFAHIHAIGGQERHGLVVAVSSSDGGWSGHDDGGLAHNLCPICIATMAVANAVPSTPPVLPHPVAHALIDRTTGPVFAFFESSRAAFQSRAPPVS
jgi:hypothetical protein